MFYAHLFDVLGNGRVLTVDLEKLHNLQHERIEFLIGTSVSDEIASRVKSTVGATTGPIMVILDSDHSRDHVRKELELYSPFVTLDSFVLVQDGSTDSIPVLGNAHPPGPLYALRDFLETHHKFEIDRERCHKVPYHTTYGRVAEENFGLIVTILGSFPTSVHESQTHYQVFPKVCLVALCPQSRFAR